MRLFTAIDIPERVRQNLASALNKLRSVAKVNWSSPANLHITTKFIGEWEFERLEELEEALEEVETPSPFPIAIKEVGYFPNPKSPRVLYSGVEAPPELAELAQRIDQTLSKLGVETETRRFSPHLTLARIKSPVDLDPLRSAIEGLGSHDFGSFTVDRFHLYESETASHGSVYHKVAEFPFQST